MSGKVKDEKKPLSPKDVEQWDYDTEGDEDDTESEEVEDIIERMENPSLQPQNGVQMQHGDEDHDVERAIDVLEQSKKNKIDEGSIGDDSLEDEEDEDEDEEEMAGTPPRLSRAPSAAEIKQEKIKLRRAAAARARMRKSKFANSQWREDRIDLIDRKNWLKEIRRFVVEFYGTWTLTLVACMVAVQSEINPRTTPVLPSFAIGFTLTILIYSVSPISGAHFNPIVSWAFLLRGMFPIQRVLIYWIAQFGGALIAAGMVYAVYRDTNNIGANIPGPVSNAEAFYFECLFTFIFVTTILSVSSRAKSIGPNAAMAIGLSLVIAHFALINTTGTGLNPARSLGPAAWVRGTALHVLWIYVAGPFAGSTAAVVFAYFISLKGGGKEGRLLAMGAGRAGDSETSRGRLPVARELWNKSKFNLIDPLVRAKPHSPRENIPVTKQTQDVEMGEVKKFGP